jgi:hypothetical protein
MMSSNPNNQTHELELEILDPRILLEEKKKALQGQPHNFSKVVSAFLSSIRYLCRKAG